MNREVEERIVAMYFDNQDFEKNAKTTIDTLGQLKEGLNLEKSAKGFDVFEKIGKNLNFEKMNQGLTKVRNGLSSMNGALGKVFKIGEAPVREAENMVNTIRGYISKVVGIDIASSLVHSVTSAFQGLVIQPISKGWNQYESEMDSVKTIMSSTGESLTVVENHLKSMTEYANKTIYSLTDMTSNLGKFTNNGVKLDQSVKAMEGIANATADAGQGAQQASMAMYNISQAIGVGKMTTIDWKSLENANIATTKLKKTFLEMAALHGKIEKKTNKDGSISYMLTKDENGKKLKQSIELTTANFREYLSKGWLDKETMLRTFEIYSGSVKESTLESWGIHDKDQKKYFMELGQQALTSATQVRTFTKMMDALKESVQSGWSESFKWIFGDMEQGTELWTRLNDELDKVLSKSSENRNKILEVWAGRNTNIESETKALEQRQEALAEAEKKLKTLKDKKEIEKQKKLIEDYHKEIKSLKKTISDKKNLPKSTIVDKQGRSGRDIAIDSLFSAIKVFKRIGSTVSEAFESVFGKLNAQGLFDFTQKIEKAIKRISKWFGTLKQPESRLSKIQKALKGVLNIVKMLINFGGKLFNLAKKIAGPVIDFLIDGAANIFGFFDGLADKSPSEILEEVGKGLKSAWDEIKRWFTPQDITDDQGKVIGKEMPVITWLKQGWEDLKKIVKDWIYESGFGEIYESVVSWWDEFKKSVDEAYAGLKEWWEGTGIPEFFENIWNKITEWFTPKKTIKPILTESGSYVLTAEEEDMPIVAFFKNLGTTIDNAFKEVEKWWKKSGIPDFFEGMWNSIVKFFSSVEHTRYNGSMLETTYEDSPFVAFFKGLGGKIDEAFKSLKGWWNKSGIPDFFQGIWDAIAEAFTPVEITGKQGNTWTKNAPVVQFFIDIYDGIKDAFEELSKWYYEKSGIPGFFQEIWDAIAEAFTPKVITGKQGNTWTENAPVVQFFIDIYEGIKDAFKKLEEWWDESDVKDFFTELWESVSGWFKNEHPGEKSGFEKFLEDIGKGISDAWNFITNEIPWEEIGAFFTNVYDFVAKLIAGGEEGTSEASGNTAQLKDVSQRHGGMIAAATDFVSDVSVHTKKLTDTVDNAGKEAPKNTKTKTIVEFISGILTSIGDFFTKVIEALNGVVLPKGVTDFLANMGDFLKGMFDVLGTVLGSMGRLGTAIATGKLGKDFWADLGNIVIPAIILGVGQIFSYLHTKHLANVDVTPLSQQFMQLCIGILALSTAIATLTVIDQSKMWPAVGAIAAIGAVVGGIFTALSLFNVSKPEKAEKVTSKERILTTLINTVGKIGMIATAMALLPGIIETIGKVKKDLGKEGEIGNDVLNVFLGLSALIVSVSLAFGLIEKVTGGNGLSIKSAVMTSLAIISSMAILIAGFELIVGLIGGISDLIGGKDNTKKVVEILNEGAEIMAAVGGAIGGFFAALFGGGTEEQKANQAKKSIEAWSEAAEVLDEKKVSGVARLMTMVRNLTEQGKSIDPGKLDGFAEAMGKLGAGIYEYASFLSGNDSVYAALSDLSDPSSEIYNRLLAFNALGLNLSDLLGSFGSIHMGDALERIDLLAKDDNIGNLVKNLNKILTGLGDLDNPETGIQFDGLTIVKKLYDAIQEGLINPHLPKFDATTIVDNICEAIGLGDSAIALAVHNMVQKGLNLSGSTGEGGGGKYPTVNGDTDWLDPELAAKLGGLVNSGSVDVSGIEKQIEQLTGKDGSITKMVDSIPNLSDVMDTKGWTNFTDADGKPIDVLGGLQEKMTELSATLNEMPLKVTITPVFDMKNLTADGMQKALSENHVPLFFNTEGMRVDFTGLSQALDMDGIRSRLDIIATDLVLSNRDQVSSINSLGSHIDSVASTIAALKLYLDTGLLVGALTPMIDRELYKEWLKH